MTGALCTAVCEVLAVTHYQRHRMMESIDRVRLYQQLSKYNDAHCFIVRYSSTTSIYSSILIFFSFALFNLPRCRLNTPPSGTDGTEDGLSQHVKKKNERGILLMTTTNYHPKRNATKPDKHNVAPLLAEYASATILKTAASLPLVSLRDNNTKHSNNPFDDVVNKEKMASLE
jgi:hypothetical protein